MSSSAVLLDLTLSDLEGQNLDWINFSPLYVENGQTYARVFIDVLGPLMWKV